MKKEEAIARIRVAYDEYMDKHREDDRYKARQDIDREKKRRDRRAIGVRSEHEEQKAICQWLDIHDVLYHSIPNGVVLSGDSIARGRYMNYLKAEGLRSGVPDLFICDITHFCSEIGVRGVYVEMKAEKGIVSPNQQKWCDRLSARGFRVVVAYGYDDAVRQLKELGYGGRGQGELFGQGENKTG